MATDKKLNSLVINTLTQAQYDSATKNEDELYLTPDDTDEQLANKQDKLVSGTNIKTVNGNSLLGSGNIEISGGSGDSSVGTIELTASQMYELNTSTKVTLTNDNANVFKNHPIVQLTYSTITIGLTFVSYYNGYYTMSVNYMYKDTLIILSGVFESSETFPYSVQFSMHPIPMYGWSLNALTDTDCTTVQIMEGDRGQALSISRTINGHVISSNRGSDVENIQFYEHNIYMLYESGDTTFCIRFAFVNNVSDTYTSVSALQGYLGTNFVKGCSGYMTSSAGYGNAYSVTYNKVSGIVGTAQASITYSDTGLTITDTIKEMS